MTRTTTPAKPHPCSMGWSTNGSAGPTIRFASWERVSTEGRQHPESSRAWQYARGKGLIEPHGGIIVAEFFDIDKSRSIPPQRRPEVSKLLAALADPDRGFEHSVGDGVAPILLAAGMIEVSLVTASSGSGGDGVAGNLIDLSQPTVRLFFGAGEVSAGDTTMAFC